MLGLRPIIVLLTILFLALLGVGIVRYWLKSRDVAETIKDRISTWVKEETSGQYKLSIGDLHIDPEKQSILVSEIVFHPADNIKSAGTLYKFRLENLLINQVTLSSLLESSLLDLSNITIAGGEFEIIRHADKNDDSTTGKPKKKFSKNGLQGIKIDSIQLSQLDLVYQASNKAITKLESVHLDLYGFHTDSLNTTTTNSLPVASFRLAIENFRTELSDKEYELKAEKFIRNGAQHFQAIIKKIELIPTAGSSLEAIAAQTPVQMDVYQLSIPEVVIDSLDYRGFLEDSIIRTPMILLNEPSLLIFNDRSRPPSTQSKIGKNPHQLIQQLIFGLEVPVLQVNNGSITYYEKNKEGTDVGKLRFGSISGNAGPILKGVETKGSLQLDLEAKLMDQVPMKAQFYFPPGPNGQFTVHASIQSFQLAALNPVIQPLARVAIRSGKSNLLNFTIQGSDQGANGKIRFSYEDLKIDLLKEKETGTTSKRPLLSLLANQLLIRTNNRLEDRKAHEFLVREDRDPTKSFFNLIWKTLFEGLKSSAGIRSKDTKPA